MSLASENNNPGDLREAGQAGSTPGVGGFASFSTPQEGFGALLNDLQSKITKNPDENLVQFSSTYAPASDGNNPGQYAANIANKLGVSPSATLGSLQSNIGSFAQAVANNEDDSTPAPKAISSVPQSTATSSTGRTSNLLGGALATGGAALAGIGSLLHSVSGSFPAIGAAIGEGVAPELGPVGPVVGGLLGEGAETLAGGTSTSSTPDTPQIQSSQTATALQNALSQTVGGNAVMQEAKARGVDPIATLEQSGAIPQPDENGNYDKATPISILQDQIAQDKNYQTSALSQMSQETSLNELEANALDEADQKMQGSPELTPTRNKIKQTFANYRAQQPKAKDQYGNEYTKSFKIAPARLQLMKERATEGENWATPSHERSASQHIYTTMKKKLSEVAKAHNVKGWDETNKRMESRILAIKAIKKMPKKAERNKRKELIHDLLAGAGGALIGKTLGNGILGGTAGYLLAHRLGGKHYKGIGTKQEKLHAQARAKQKEKSLLIKK